MTLENIALCDNGNIELCDNGNIAFCPVPAPCSCPCGSWPPVSWPCSGLVEEYIVHEGGTVGSYFSHVPDQKEYQLTILADSVLTAYGSASCEWNGSVYYRIQRWYDNGTIRIDTTRTRVMGIRIISDDSCFWQFFWTAATASYPRFNKKETGQTPVGTYLAYQYFKPFGTVLITEAT